MRSRHESETDLELIARYMRVFQIVCAPLLHGRPANVPNLRTSESAPIGCDRPCSTSPQSDTNGGLDALYAQQLAGAARSFGQAASSKICAAFSKGISQLQQGQSW